MNKIDKILKDAEENGIAEEVRDEIQKLNNENNELRRKNQILQIEKSSSKAEQFRQSNKNLKEKNKKLNEKLNKLVQKRKMSLGHLSREELGVYNRMLTDFEAMQLNQRVIFPGANHPIFNRFFELANKYPNRDFIVTSLRKKVDEKINLIEFEIKTQKHNIELINKCEEMIDKYPDTWEEEVDKKMAYLYRVTTIDDIEQKIEQLNKDIDEVDKWFVCLKNKIDDKPSRTTAKVKNNLYYEIFNEFDRIYDFCINVGGVAQYKANIMVDSFNKDDLYSSLTRELEKQVGLCEEPYTHNFYYSNGEGRLIPYELNRQFLQYINENTTFIKYDGKKNQYKSGNIINSKVLFNEVPLYCNKIQYRNPNLVGFNNCFYDIENNEVVKLNPQVPIMPLKNTKVELYLKDENEIERNPMQHIFEDCFTKEDARTILAYLGCALFDKGYTQRQESLFIMGKGGTGKGLSIEEYLPTPTGWIQMKDLKVGDKLFDEKGNVCNVTYKSPIHNIDCYKITFENGYEMIVDKEHRWLTKTEGEKRMTVQNTEDMYNRMSKSHRKRDSFYFAIDTAEPLQLDEKDFIVPPYTLGAWLGDGTQAEGIITNQINDNQIIKEIEKDGFTTNRTGVDNNLRVYVHKLKDKLRYINVLNNKHIPQEYLRGSYQQRLSLLQGIMDTDGNIDNRGSCEIIWASKQLINQLRELLFSLGIKSNISEKQVQLEGWNEPRTYYRLYFKTRLPVFRLKRKKDRIPSYPLRKTQYTRYIKKIEPVESVPTQCIQVDSPNHLFLAGKEFIPTHNTTFTKAICSIFYNVGHQLVGKFKDSNEFGLSVFADSDVVIIDEIQSAPKEFANKLKNISSSDALPVEKKHFDTISIPAENVPRMFLIGNNFSKRLYEESDSEGVRRRILIVIPTKPIQSLGYQWKQLIQPSCQQWLVQEAIEEYKKQCLHKKAIPIGSNPDDAYITDGNKNKRLEMCVYPEQFFIKEHFEIAYIGDETIDNNELIKYSDMFDFIKKCIDEYMVESTCKQSASNMFIGEVNKALKLDDHRTRTINGEYYFTGIVPKSEEAIKYFNQGGDND